MKTQHTHKKKRIRYLIGFALIVILALWMTSCPAKALRRSQAPTNVTAHRNDTPLIEAKKQYKTGVHVPAFQRMFIAPVMDDSNLTILFRDHLDYTGLIDSMAGTNWHAHTRNGLNQSIPAFLSQYRDDLEPFVYGEWQKHKLRVPDTTHFIAQCQIESISMKKTRKRELKWQIYAEHQFGVDTAKIDHCQYTREVEINAMLRITTPDGTQVLRRPIRSRTVRDKSYFDRQGPSALLRRAPKILSNDMGGHTISGYTPYIEPDSNVVKRALFDLSKEAVRCTGKWLISPIITARKHRGSIFDIREGTIERKEYIRDTSRLTDRYPKVPIYKPFKH